LREISPLAHAPDGIGDTSYAIDQDNIDHYPLMKLYAGPHDVGITSVNAPKSIIGQGYNLTIRVRIMNYGEQSETLDASAMANLTTVQTQVSSVPLRALSVNFTWNTTGYAKGNHTLQAVAEAVAGETDTTDNNRTDSWVIVAMVGDITSPAGWLDGKVDVRDVAKAAKLFGANYPDPRYDPN